MKIIIVGAGLAGLASAIALTKCLDQAPEITIVELRSQPSSIGGAIGLTPNALRVLHFLGVLDVIRKRKLGYDVDFIELFNTYNGSKLGQIHFTDSNGKGIGDPPLKELRIMRADLLQALTETATNLQNCQLHYGKPAKEIKESDDDVVLTCEDGSEYKADLLLGCDGVHSFVRTSFIEPDRKQTYTGIAAVFGFTDIKDGQTTPWVHTGLCQSQRGTCMGSYFEPTKSKSFLAAIMEIEDVKSREGWKAMGSDQEKIKKSVLERHSTGVLSSQLHSLIEHSRDWGLYPVYSLGPGGKWCSKRTLLIGDAAHAMPPQGESAGIAFEDSVLFARTLALSQQKSQSLQAAFAAYEKLRRPSVNKSYQESSFGWDTQKDCNWFTFQMRGWLTWIFLWWTANARRARYEEDISTMDLKVEF